MNAIAGRSQQAGAGVSGTRQGTVTAYDPASYSVKVQLQPTGEETGWIPLATMWAGNGYGVVAGPAIGAVIEVEFDSGLMGAGMAVGQFFNDVDRSPAPPSGQFWVIDPSGSSFKLTNDGKVTITDGAGSTFVMNGDGTGTVNLASGLTINASITQINGDLKVSGSIKDQNGAKDTVQKIREVFDAHVHNGVQTGSGSTNIPTTQL
ncbi:phage baseplate assembly protein V [Rahnella sp. ChDrAdgB13]|uniref:phage baseplate assembly protein V n=1 Tax=Rahnella sp. ChDrAdgB13 TaxID=1850581 RepID=UPI001FCCA65D|nr:phage baseplate assembly protein V [Rahnella sp. ChDrAdgB13]